MTNPAPDPQGPQPTAEARVRDALRRLEADTREMALRALADWERAEVVSPELFEAIAGLQRPAWGTWKGLLDALRKARRRVQRTGSADERRRVEGAVTLQAVLEFLDAPAPPSARAGLEQAGRFVRPSLPPQPKIIDLLPPVIYLRNRVVHDTPSDVAWWEQAASAAMPIDGVLRPCLDTLTGAPEPWFRGEGGRLLSFNGLAPDDAVILASREGEARTDTGLTQAVLLAFRRLLGKEESTERDFKKLLGSLAPEEVRGFFLGDYLVGPPAGSGGFATVHVARQLSTGRKVALKLLRDGQSEETRARFQQEAAFLSRFQHPNIVSVIGCGEETWSEPRAFDLTEAWATEFKRSAPVKTYIALEWIGGPTLDQVFREQIPRGEREAARWFLGAAEALSAVHTAGMIHRDVKPGNLMLTSEGVVKLMDFGIARSLGETRTLVTEEGRAVGTPAYMSPEQLRAKDAEAEVGPATDVYSLCATFYEVFTGRRIYKHDSESEDTVKVTKLAGTPPERPRALAPGMSWEVDTILLGGLQADLADRYRSMEALAQDLRRFLEDRPIAYRRPSLLRRMRLGYRRNRVVWNLTLGFVALAVVGVAVYIQAIRAEQARTLVQKTRADANYRRAREVVDEFFTRVSDEDLSHLPGFQTVQSDLLRRSEAYYREFVKEQPDDPESLLGWGGAWARIGAIVHQTGKMQEAIELFGKARDVFEAYLLDHPADAPCRLSLAKTLAYLGGVHLDTNRPTEAVAECQRALDLVEGLRNEGFGSEECQRARAQSALRLGTALWTLGQADASLRSHETAVEAYRWLLERNPKSIGNTEGMALAELSVAEAKVRLGLDAEARDHRRRALQGLERLYQVRPNRPSVAARLAACYQDEGDAAFKRKDRPRATESYRKASDLWERLVRENPAVTRYRRDGAAVIVRMAVVASEQQMTADAQGLFEKAICEQRALLDADPQMVSLITDLAKSLDDYGSHLAVAGHPETALANHQEARLLVEQLVSGSPSNPSYRGQLGVVCNNLARTLIQLGRVDDADAAFSAAVEQHEEAVRLAPSASAYREFLCDDYGRSILFRVNLGRYDGTQAESTRLLELSRSSEELSIRCALTFAKCVKRIDEDAAGHTSKGAEARRTLLSLAVECIANTCRGGFRDAKFLREDPRLDPLRSNADFQRLVDELGHEGG